jgi:diguanylate cyclase (GGDEF)-like protein
MPGSNTNQVPPGERAPRSTIRRRILVVLAVEFAIVMGVATVEGFWPSAGPGSGLALVILFGCAAIVPVAMAALTRPIMREVVGLEEENRRLHELYGLARLDSLLDGLTGLGNHRAFQEELVRQLEGSRRNNTPLALLLVDVDDLKSVNDQRGHASGDELLVNVGKTILLSLRRPDRAFRVGGDEFAVMLPGADLDTGYAVGRRILASALDGGDPTRPTDPVSLSIGVSAYPAPSTRADLLYQHADAALYWCKRHGRTTAAAYDPSRHGVSPDDRSDEDLSAAISKVLAEKLLSPVYQPIFSLASGEPIGYEGLIRPTEGSMIPDATTLFAAAGRADRTVELDMACLEAIAQGVGELEPGIYLSINLSPRTLESDLFHPIELTDIFARRGISPNQLVVELTEREEVQDLPNLRRNAAACRKAGIRLAADDVGSGNAGLRLLNEIHFDIVKIDLSLVQGGIHHDPSHGVLRALQELATRWSATIVAEGVETGEQLAAIRELGLTAGQGYLLGRPSPERRAERLDLENLIPDDWLHRVGSPAA